MAGVPAERGRQIGLFVVGAVIGALIVMFLIYPPAPGWGSDEKWGDIATWVSSVMTFGAVVFALYIANRDRMDRAIERKADQHDANFRAAISLQGAMANLIAVADFALGRLREWEKSGVDQISGGLGSSELFALNRAELARIGNLDNLVQGVTGEFARQVLSALAWCRETVSLLDKAIVSFPGPPPIQLLIAGNIPGLVTSYRILLASAQGANDAISALIGDELNLAAEPDPA